VAARPLDEKGRDVAHPTTVERRGMQFQRYGIDARIPAHAFRTPATGIALNSQVHVFMRSEMADKFYKGPADGRKLARPVIFIRGESQMCRPVRLPLGGQPDGATHV